MAKGCRLGIEISNGNRMGGMLFADDLVAVSESTESLQKLIDVQVETKG